MATFDKSKDQPTVVYKGKHTKLSPFLLFVHDGQEILASGWDVDEEGDNVFLCYPVEGAKVFLDKEICAMPNEPIESSIEPWHEEREWDYYEDPELVIGEPTKDVDTKTSKEEFEAKVREARERIIKDAEIRASERVDLAKAKDKEKVVSTVSTTDDRTEDVDDEPTTEDLEAEIVHKKRRMPELTREREKKDSVLDSLSGVDDADDFLMDMTGSESRKVDKTLSRLSKLVTSGKEETSTKRLDISDEIERAEMAVRIKRKELELSKMKELEEKGYADTTTSESISMLKKLREEEEELRAAILRQKMRMAEMEELHKSPFRSDEKHRAATTSHMEDRFLHGADRADTRRVVHSGGGDGFSKIAAVRLLSEDVIIDNAELILMLASMTPKQKEALLTVAQALAGAIG